MTIKRIENLTYEEALKISVEEMEIKEHQVVFAECGESFGYSALVFKNGKHIYYANDYELHHGYMVRESGKDALRQWYIDSLNRKLYTDAELLEDIKSYDEYEKKDYFLRNYYIMRYDYVSIFGIDENPKKERKKFPFFNSVSFCYVADKAIVTTQAKFANHLKASYAGLQNNMETFREMISRELSNHEACITCDYKEALDALEMNFEDLTEEQQKIVKEELQKQIDSYCI